MNMLPLTQWLKRFRDDETGTVTIEMVVVLPLLFWGLAATYELFELHRYNSARDKAGYVVADMLSREMQSVTPTYIDNTKTVFDTISNDNGENQIRVSVVHYDNDSDEFSVRWSQVRGPGTLEVLTDQDVRNAHDSLPNMNDGEEVIVVESQSKYPALFNIGLSDDLMIENRILTSPRFAPQIIWEDD